MTRTTVRERPWVNMRVEHPRNTLRCPNDSIKLATTTRTTIITPHPVPPTLVRPPGYYYYNAYRVKTQNDSGERNQWEVRPAARFCTAALGRQGEKKGFLSHR